jgi:hypothetical protein
MTTQTSTKYQLEGRLLEVCSCEILCPCWVGENPDGDTCDSAIAWRIDKGQALGVDISGLTLALAVHIPGNVLKGHWKAVVYVEHWKGGDERKQAFRLGLHHGLFCLGCCWSLMLLMFAVGTGNLSWMLLLGAVMAVEKNTRIGRLLSPLLGLALLAWGVYLVGGGLF